MTDNQSSSEYSTLPYVETPVQSSYSLQSVLYYHTHFYPCLFFFLLFSIGWKRFSSFISFNLLVTPSIKSPYHPPVIILIPQFIYFPSQHATYSKSDASYIYGWRQASYALALLTIFIEPIRLYLGYFGNLKETIPQLLLFNVLTVFPGLLSVIFLLCFREFNLASCEECVYYIQGFLLLIELLSGVWILSKSIKANSIKFYIAKALRAPIPLTSTPSLLPMESNAPIIINHGKSASLGKKYVPHASVLLPARMERVVPEPTEDLGLPREMGEGEEEEELEEKEEEEESWEGWGFLFHGSAGLRQRKKTEM